MELVVLPDADAVAAAAARMIAEESRAAVSARGRFVMAVSGGRTPWRMLRVLSGQDLPWEHVHFVQTDERVAPEGSEERNLTHLRESLSQGSLAIPGNLHPMLVLADELEEAALGYTRRLRQIAGSPPILDLAHLGLGIDGHAASLIPGDPVLDVVDRDVALTGSGQGRRRMTLTYPMLNRSRRILWLVTGGDKAMMLLRLFKGDVAIPAGRIRREEALVLADRPAAARL